MTDSRAPWPWWIVPVIFLTAVAVNASDYSVLVPRQDLRIATHRAIVDGTAPPLVQHRVLIPAVLEPAIRVASTAMPADKAVTRTYAVFHLLALAGVLFVTYGYCSLWFTRDRSLIAALLIGSTIRLSLRQGEYWDGSPIPDTSVFAPWSILDAVVIGHALGLLYHGRRAGFLILIAIAALNSEASVLLPMLAAVHARQTGWRLAAAAAATWAIVTGGLHVAFGASWPTMTWQENRAHLGAAIVNLALWLGPALVLVAAGWRHAPAFARRSIYAAAPFVAAFAAFGYWWDVRTLLPLYPLLAPLLLSAVWRPRAA